jgi:hypothetical protein
LIENSIDSLKLIIKRIEMKNWLLCCKRYQKDLERFRKNLEHRNYIFTQKYRKYRKTFKKHWKIEKTKLQQYLNLKVIINNNIYWYLIN